MRVELLQPDVAPSSQSSGASQPAAFARALDAVGAILDGATRAEDAYAHGGGSLQAAVYERGRADVALAVVTAAAQRAAQAVQTMLNLQI